MKLIRRDIYLDKMKEAMGTPDIKVITGIRGCGKSKLMESFMDDVKRTDPGANLIHICLNQNHFKELLDYHVLHEYVESAHVPGKNNYILIEEIQMCAGYERAINGFHASEKFDIYITGSGDFLDSSDLSTLFTGRTFEIKVFPFSFQEFMQYYELTDQYAAFSRYLQEGGMSGSYPRKSEESKLDYLSVVFDTLVAQDILSKYNIRNMALMYQLSDFLIGNISNLASARSIANALAAAQIKTNDRTISAYLKCLCSSFAFYRIRRYDIHNKRSLASNEKYYLCDHSFRYARFREDNRGNGWSLENIVAMELLRRGYELYTGVFYKCKIDFVAIKRGEKLYIQVANSIDDPDTFRSEVESLLKIRDAYPKVILTRTRQEPYQYEGIRIVDVADWLLGS